ncbi:hypothetical protein HDV05_001451 [Chytridiales sp. JEL 0842]|nr:hypothetical protein HDV05_001451 [Chytridiales sp. JEL 0842]
MVFAEKYIIDRLNHWRITNKYDPNKDELACFDSYQNSFGWVISTNLALWSTLAYLTLDFRPNPKVPRYTPFVGAISISLGLFGTMFLSTKYAARSCVQCLLDQKDKRGEFYTMTRKLVKEYYSEPNAYFENEKFKLLRPAEGIEAHKIEEKNRQERNGTEKTVTTTAKTEEDVPPAKTSKKGWLW